MKVHRQLVTISLLFSASLIFAACSPGADPDTGVAVQAATVRPDTLIQGPRSCTWFASKDSLSQVQSGASSVSVNVPVCEAQAIAMNAQDCGVWVLGKEQLRRYDATGAVVLELTLDAIEKKLKQADQLVVDPYDGSLWIAGDKGFAHLSSTGTLLSLHAFDDSVRSAAVTLDQSLWLLEDKLIARFSAAGVPLDSIKLKQDIPGTPKRIAVDSIVGAFWVSTNKKLVQVKLSQLNQPAVTIQTSEHIEAIALDPLTSRLWVADKDSLDVYDSGGVLVQSVDLAALGLKDPENIAFDPVDKVLWVGTKKAVARLSSQGVLQATFSIKDGVSLLAVPAFSVQPQITLVEPLQDAVTNNALHLISIGYDAQCNGQPCGFAPSYLASYSLTAALNGQQVGPLFVFDLTSKQANFTPASPLPEGTNTLEAQVKDSSGRLSNTIAAQFTVDTVAPVITISSPQTGLMTNQPVQTIAGSVSEPASLLVNNLTIPVSASGTFSASVTLQEGLNQVNLTAVDRAGNTGSAQLDLTLNTRTPAPVGALINVSTPTSGRVMVIGAAGAVPGSSSVTITNLRSGTTVTVVAGVNGDFNADIAAVADDVLSLVAAVAAVVSAPNQFIVPGGAEAPPDPSPVPLPPSPTAVATPIGLSVPTQLANSAAFLYSGPNPIQTGVAPGTIASTRAAIVQGKVQDRAGQPIPGVAVTVYLHPELGQTLTREDGAFDLVVNGGGTLTLSYNRAGYLPSHRTLLMPVRDFFIAPTIALVRADPVRTVLAMSAPAMQVAKSSVVTDQDGTRQSVLVFPAGTTATMILPNGASQVLSAATVRATEYTVGPSGAMAMPSTLPSNSAYTYAIENSIDEALAAGATAVQFDRPIYQYVDNFLNFPIGGVVPSGYYDRQKAVWIPSDDGVIVKVLSVNGGLASIDSTGTSTPDDPARLAQLGLSDDELARIAGFYLPGKSFWRVPLTHFTPYDYNWPYGPPDDAQQPNPPLPTSTSMENKPDCQSGGSFIECQNQSLGESVPIVGTPFTLNYKSSRMPGFRSQRTLQIPVTGASVPASLKRVYVVVRIAGKYYKQDFDAQPNRTFALDWDGTDAYGRATQGAQLATVIIAYVYPAFYRPTFDWVRSFANFGISELNLSSTRSPGEFTITNTNTVMVGALQNDDTSLIGGWTIDVHHRYDPGSQTLLSGDGSSRQINALGSTTITTIAGNGSTADVGDGGPAIQAGFNEIGSIAVDPAGVLFIADTFHSRIRKITADGKIHTIAGTGIAGFHGEGDGGPATAAKIGFPRSLAFDNAGNLYFWDGQFSPRIRRVSTDGIITTFAGNGQAGNSGDSGPAANANIDMEGGAAFDHQGRLHFCQSGSTLVATSIRKIESDGTITTEMANVDCRGPMQFDSEGNLYFAAGKLINKIGNDGVIRIIAGGDAHLGPHGWVLGDGGPATDAAFFVRGMTVDSVGNLYVSDFGIVGYRVRKITADGIINTVAGGDRFGFSGDGGYALAALLSPDALAAAPGGALYIVNLFANGGSVVRKLTSSSTTIHGADIFIPSADGSNIFLFDFEGHHTRTLWAATGALRYSFGYDSAGRLVSVTDGDNNVTRLERDAQGNPSAFVGPDGHRTLLSVDGNGYLQSITNPAGDSSRAVYTADGLMTQFSNPRNQTSYMFYDATGRLIKDQNAAGGFWELVRDVPQTRVEQVTVSSALGRATAYKTEHLSTNEVKRTTRQPSGEESVSQQGLDGSTTTQFADGTIATIIDGPDPRFGIAAPFVASRTVALPSGLTYVSSSARAAILNPPSDPLALVTQTDTTTVNDKTSIIIYNASQRQYTLKSPLNRQATLSVDAQSRPVLSQTTGVAPVSYSYDIRGRLSGISRGSAADTRAFTFAYDSQGQLASTTDPLGRTVGYQYDPANRLTRKILPDARVIQFSYDPNGNVTSITPPSRPSHSFSYTPVDLQQQYNPPAAGTIATPATQYAYNLDKQLTTLTRPDGQVAQFGYDNGGRLSTLSAPHGVTQYTYTPIKGTLATVTAPGGVVMAYTYDGTLLLNETWSGPIAGTVSRAYNNDFNVSSLTIAGTSFPYSYDNDMLLTGAGALTIARNPGNGFITSSQLQSIATSQTYDPFGELQNFSATAAGTTLFSQTYSYDKLGRITQKLEQIQGRADTFGYGYDLAGRLITVSKNGTVITTYQYDGNGNRTSDGVNQASYDDQDRLTQYGAASYTYTDNGELKTQVVGSQQASYDYDVLGNLRKVIRPDGIVIDYVVDGKNRRVGKKVNGAIIQGLLYQNQLNPVAELDSTGDVKSRFVYASRANVPDFMQQGSKIYRIVSDNLGSVRMVVDASTGAVAQRMDYDVYGVVILDSNPGFQPFGFAGGVYDQHTKLTRFGARDYDALTGRWTAKDPIRFAGGDTSLMAYVQGNPVNLIDPDGLQPLLRYEQPMPRLLPNITEPSLRQLGENLSGAIGAIKDNKKLYDDYNGIVTYCESKLCPIPQYGGGTMCTPSNPEGLATKMSEGPFLTAPGQGMAGCICLKLGVRLLN